ncbi:MAG: hypothetical protein FXF49_05590 [Flexistipes sinusarabici]|uniref:Uncharacterized protein n=1 Tax=Flexistipes sinusarabici TaxID=2352 RepID=A0A5D0MIS3_FLESI|nr:hypothetical protein [Flexistipes sinusarabici]TYB33577.1 MAG: hypothetical protein FXF49_05590 [Flexistipes sinusarabici]
MKNGFLYRNAGSILPDKWLNLTRNTQGIFDIKYRNFSAKTVKKWTKNTLTKVFAITKKMEISGGYAVKVLDPRKIDTKLRMKTFAS